MFKVFGSGKKYKLKEDGKTVNHECPHCHVRGTFKEVIRTDYTAVFFIQIFKEQRKSRDNYPYFACPNCKEVFLFYRERSVYSGVLYTFKDYLRKKLDTIKSIVFKSDERSKKSRAARDIEKELPDMKRKMTNQPKSGDR